MAKCGVFFDVLGNMKTQIRPLPCFVHWSLGKFSTLMMEAVRRKNVVCAGVHVVPLSLTILPNSFDEDSHTDFRCTPPCEGPQHVPFFNGEKWGYIGTVRLQESVSGAQNGGQHFHRIWCTNKTC
jgi:hypothetical protein